MVDLILAKDSVDTVTLAIEEFESHFMRVLKVLDSTIEGLNTRSGSEVSIRVVGVHGHRDELSKI